MIRKAHLGMVKYAPSLWGGIYSWLDNSRVLGNGLQGLTRLKETLWRILSESQPDCVVSTYPAYAHVIQQLFREDQERAFRFITVITDSISVNSAWYRAPSDWYCVANQETAQTLIRGGVDEARVRAVGFPVSPLFSQLQTTPLLTPRHGLPRRILYLVNHGKQKLGKALDRLLEKRQNHLTITVGRDASLKAKLLDRTKSEAHRVEIYGWTNEMPRLMASHHLLIGKAGGATVQEAIAARCPMIVNQVIPGQEEGNARLIREWGLGAVAETGREVADAVDEAFAHDGRLWEQWRENLQKRSRPDASIRLAEMILHESDAAGPASKKITLFTTPPAPAAPAIARTPSGHSRRLLCDFHMHSNYSDGKLSVPELVDFYGRLNFDCICITDHLADPRRLLGKLIELSNLTLSPAQLDEYFDVIDRERRRAWRKYGMLVMTGIEFNKDGFTKKSSAHLLGVDLQAPINPALDLPETITQIHAQGGLAVASHPHLMKTEWGKNTLYLWEHQDEYAPLIDAWEIANRNNLFSPIGRKRLPFLANSDFHKPKHIYSWKTVLHCEKDPEAIKECIRRNEHVAITLYRDYSTADAAHVPGPPIKIENWQPALPLQVAGR